MRRSGRLLLFTALALCLGTLSVFAQATSSLRGKVADAQGEAEEAQRGKPTSHRFLRVYRPTGRFLGMVGV